MARTFTGSTSVYAEYAGAVATVAPLTMSAWIYPATVNTYYTAVSLNHPTDATYFRLTTNTTGNIEAWAALAASGTARATSSTAMGAANTWYHACGVYTSTTSRTAYLNGGGKITDTTSMAPTGLTRTSIGVNHYGTNFFVVMNGRIAEVGIWNVALADAEVLALASGINLQRVRPASLVGYWPLWGLASPEPDITSANHPMTLNGSPVASNHAPIRMFNWFPPVAPLIETAAGTVATRKLGGGIGSRASSVGTSMGL